jgi:hypothetical protein
MIVLSAFAILIKTTPMTNNTQLPAEVVHTIEMAAQELLAYEPDNRWAYRKGATEYAIKLNKLQQEYDKLNRVCGSSISHAEGVGEKYLEARALLSKFISRHEAGLLPDRFVYNEIKTFLDGTK